MAGKLAASPYRSTAVFVGIGVVLTKIGAISVGIAAIFVKIGTILNQIVAILAGMDTAGVKAVAV